jgi:hypothetical protein
MKKKLNLMNLTHVDELSRKKMGEIKAGVISTCVQGGCGCGCCAPGGSGTQDNYNANSDGGLHSPGCTYEELAKPI